MFLNNSTRSFARLFIIFDIMAHEVIFLVLPSANGI
jgi:hypothetical protein